MGGGSLDTCTFVARRAAGILYLIFRLGIEYLDGESIAATHAAHGLRHGETCPNPLCTDTFLPGPKKPPGYSCFQHTSCCTSWKLKQFDRWSDRQHHLKRAVPNDWVYLTTARAAPLELSTLLTAWVSHCMQRELLWNPCAYCPVLN